MTPLSFFYHWEKSHPNLPFLRQPVDGRWIEYSYAQAGKEARKIAAFLLSLDLPPASNIAILSKNCAHWIMADLAIMMAGHISVPIYPTLTAPSIKHLLEHSEARVIFLGKLDAFESQQDGIPSEMIQINFPFYGPPTKNKWDELLERHTSLEGNPERGAHEVATIMYSSGTTGTPKGVLLSFGAFGLVGDRVFKNFGLPPHQHYFSYLPLSHIAERGLLEMVALASGSTISYAESMDKFSENLQHEQPTIFGGVPRIWSKFQEGILAKLPQKKLDMALSIPIVNSIVRKKIRKKLGLSRAGIIVSGAAPIPVNLLKWYKKLGIEIREMFGMTENTAYSHANYKEVRIGTVGQPWPEVEVKLSDEGEILIRHGALMKGYYKDPETTAAVFTSDGFLKTGDRGAIDEEGFLTITGRIKDQFKSDKGKFISPAVIELKLLVNTDVEMACVVGMSIPQPIALIVLSQLGKKKAKDSLEKSLSDTVHNVNATLENYERLETVVIMKEPWTIENGLLTPSLKVKRNEIEKIHAHRYKAWFSYEGDILWE